MTTTGARVFKAAWGYIEWRCDDFGYFWIVTPTDMARDVGYNGA